MLTYANNSTLKNRLITKLCNKRFIFFSDNIQTGHTNRVSIFGANDSYQDLFDGCFLLTQNQGIFNKITNTLHCKFNVSFPTGRWPLRMHTSCTDKRTSPFWSWVLLSYWRCKDDHISKLDCCLVCNRTSSYNGVI